MKIRRDSQNATLLVHLAKGKKLTRLSALAIFHVQNITARITEMRRVAHFARYGCALSTQTEQGTRCTTYPIIEGVTKLDANKQSYEEYSIPNREDRVALGSYLSKLRRAA